MEGNQQKMREALGDVYNILEKIQSFTPRLNDVSLMREFRSRVCHAKRVIDTALADPPRQCDVGTEEEQTVRFDAFVRDRRGDLNCTGKCPAHNGVDFGVVNCVLQWAQTPYDAEEGGAE